MIARAVVCGALGLVVAMAAFVGSIAWSVGRFEVVAIAAAVLALGIIEIGAELKLW